MYCKKNVYTKYRAKNQKLFHLCCAQTYPNLTWETSRLAIPFPTKVFFFEEGQKYLFKTFFFFASGQYLFIFFFFRWASVFIYFLFFLLESRFSRFVLSIFQSNRAPFFAEISPLRSRFQKFKMEFRALIDLLYLPHQIATDFDKS